jgi:hypothetical protein
MDGEGSFSAGKCPAYCDLDAANWDDVVATPLEFSAPLNTQSGLSSTSEKKKKQKVFAYERNPNYLPKEYGHFVRKVVLDYYNVKTVGVLQRTFIDHGADGLMSLQLELNARLELYNNYDKDFWDHGRWMDQQIISSTSNILHSFECIFKKEEDEEWNSWELALFKKLKKTL